MANVTAKTSSNIFYKARCEAATHNEQLSSREGAADYMSIDRGRLYRIESGIAIPYPEEIRLMADLYNAPELENYFCRTMCPLGCEMPKVELANLDRLTVRTLSVPDGSYKTHMETKRICLDDEESKYRLEFMDKSIMGIHDWRAAKAASEMFKGEWKDDPEKTNQWGKPEKYYVIADSDREKYIERSILVNMTLLRKTASEKAQTGAILRVIRALLGIKGTYSKAELEKPFVVPTVTFAPDYTDPTVRSAMLQQGMNSMGNMFGASSTPPAISTAFSGEAFSSDFNPEDEIDNPAFTSEQVEDSDGAVEEQERNWFDQEQPAQEQPQSQPTTNGNETTGYFCDGCGAEINERVYEYSLNKFGRPLCMKCQKGAGK